MKEKKGQMTIIGLVMFSALLVTLVAVYPLISSSIDSFTAASNNTMAVMVINALPLFIALAILITLFMYVTVFRG